MKKFFLITLLLIVASTIFAQSQKHEKLHWLTDFEKAKAIAKKEHKPILMLFTGSDWCPPCKMMHNELFEDKNFINIADKVVLVLVDFPKRKPLPLEQRKQNYALNSKFHGGGVPTFVAINADEKVLGKQVGYRPGFQTNYINFFKKMIERNKTEK